MAVEWSEIEEVATTIFQVWAGDGDVQWAKAAWAILAKAGLTDDSTELERCKSLIRLLCLADYYYDCCTLYLDESIEPDLVAWAEALAIPGFRVAQLIGPSEGLSDDLDEWVLYQEAIAILVPEFSDEVIAAIEQGWGDRKQLFIALCRSALKQENNDPTHPDYLTDNAALNRYPSGYAGFTGTTGFF